MKLKKDVLHAVYIGGMSAFTYPAAYIMRNILSAASPGMLEQNILTNENLVRCPPYFLSPTAKLSPMR